MNNEKFVPSKPLNMPVLFLIFNRPDTTKQVFEAIREAKPPRLYVASDGPRENKNGEEENILAIRNYVLENIDWNCEVKTLFQDKNLGCKYAVSGAINWFFENEEMGIILEDDCLPSQSFFWFCEELLNKYKDDLRIFLISGYNKQNIWKTEQDYFYSHFGGIWGWASWRRAWSLYDIDVSDINEFVRTNKFEHLLGIDLGLKRKKDILNGIKHNKNAWDYQWAYTRHKNSGLACVSSKSLIKNIGFGINATHTFGENEDGVELHELKFPLKENMFVVPDRQYDIMFIAGKGLLKRIKNIIKILLDGF